eukprot:CAMPEP_0115572818 /NCGR_PEP_ID=MMETSP0272-20121206/673_1 /TAXON_ID=71861 /ORGANISM="Scrippsiella trochoidea, Strain CCMP3099" /LENGTH=664 /DNA_ID=CAMNT_0003007451 /DNA_START=451 /DNA_END=2442 /DNA_ORIENTATION=+
MADASKSTRPELLQQNDSFPATQLYLDDASPGAEGDDGKVDHFGQGCPATQLYSDDTLLTSDHASAFEQISHLVGGSGEQIGASLPGHCLATQLYMEDADLSGDGGSKPWCPAEHCSTNLSSPDIATQLYSDDPELVEGQISARSGALTPHQCLHTGSDPVAQSSVNSLDECAATQLYMEDVAGADDGSSALRRDSCADRDPSLAVSASQSHEYPATQLYLEDPIFPSNVGFDAVPCTKSEGSRKEMPDDACQESTNCLELELRAADRSRQRGHVSSARVEHAEPEPKSVRRDDIAISSPCIATQIHSGETNPAHEASPGVNIGAKEDQSTHHDSALHHLVVPSAAAPSTEATCAETQIYPEDGLMPSDGEIQDQSCISRGSEGAANAVSSLSFLDNLPATQLYLDAPILSADSSTSAQMLASESAQGTAHEQTSSSQQRTSAWHQHAAPPSAKGYIFNASTETQHHPKHVLSYSASYSASEVSQALCGAACSESLQATQAYPDEPILAEAASLSEGAQYHSGRRASSSPQRTLASHHFLAKSALESSWSRQIVPDLNSKILRGQTCVGGDDLGSDIADTDQLPATQIYPDELVCMERGTSPLQNSASPGAAISSSNEDLVFKRPAPFSWEVSEGSIRSKTPKFDEPLSESLPEWSMGRASSGE